MEKELIAITQEDKSILLTNDQKYKVINMPFSRIVKDPFYVNFNCPVEMVTYSVIEPLDGNYTDVSIKFRNKTDKQISAIKFDVYFYNIFYDPIEICNGNFNEIVFLDLQLEPLKVLNADNVFKISCLDNIRRIKVIVKKVVFDDGIRWLYNKEDLIEIKTTLLDGKEIENLRTVIGRDAICYPKKENQYWQCVCGNVNSYVHDSCDNCQRIIQHIFENAVNNNEVIERYKKALLEKKEKQEQEVKAHDKKFTLIFVAVLFIFFVYIFFISVSN